MCVLVSVQVPIRRHVPRRFEQRSCCECGRHHKPAAISAQAVCTPDPPRPTSLVCAGQLFDMAINSKIKGRKNQKRTDFELAELHQKRALALRMKGRKTEVIHCMVEHPEVISDLRQLCVTKGFLAPIEGDALVQEEASAASSSRTEMAQLVQPPDGATAEDDAGSPQAKRCKTSEPTESLLNGMPATIPETYTKIGGELHGLSAKWVKYLLAMLEPISLSSFAIRALVPPGKREIDLQAACAILEFMTGLDESTAIVGDLRQTERLVSEMRRRNEDLRRPARELLLPPDWGSCGWYRLENHTEEGLWLTMLGENPQHAAFVTPAHMGMTAGAGFMSLSIDRNFSKMRAEIVDTGRMKRLQCQMFYLRFKQNNRDEPSGDGNEKKVEVAGGGAQTRSEPKQASATVDETTIQPPPPAPDAGGQEQQG